MNKSIVIVEGPSGCGKTTYIQNQLSETTSQVSLVFSSERLPRDVVGSGVAALRNDTWKLFSAVLLFLNSPELDTILVDRMIVSQMVYHELRTETQRYHRSIRFSLGEVRTRFMGMCSYLNLMLPSYLASYSYEADYPELAIDISLKLIVPEWEELQRRRKGSGREYPAGRHDYELYEYLYSQSSGTELIGQLVL